MERMWGKYRKWKDTGRSSLKVRDKLKRERERDTEKEKGSGTIKW